MVRRSYRSEKIINKLRKVEILLSQGSTIGEAARKIGVTDMTYYRWRREGLKVPQKQPKRGRLWLTDGSCIRLKTSNTRTMCGAMILW